MRAVLLFGLVLMACGCKNKKNAASKSDEVTVVINVTRSGVYCGGARPTDQMLEEIQSAKPFADKAIYVRLGAENDLSKKVVATAKTGADGKVILSLPLGTYSLVDDSRKDDVRYKALLKQFETPPMYYGPMDKGCLATWLSTPDLTFTVAAGANNVFQVNYSDKCSWQSIPCAQYNGPLPP